MDLKGLGCRSSQTAHIPAVPSIPPLVSDPFSHSIRSAKTDITLAKWLKFMEVNVALSSSFLL